jgi:undecaprenyl pyrophosphate synthase
MFLLSPSLLLGWQWLQNTIASNAQNIMLKILAAGPIPKHIAFVMDGNRRYARMNHKEVQQGHSDGFIALRRVSCWNQGVLLTDSVIDAGSLPDVEHTMCLCLRVLH